MFEGPSGFGRIMNIFMCTIMCAVLSVVIPLIIESTTGATGILTPIGFLQSFILSFCVAYPFGDLIPAVSWGGMLAEKIHAKGVLAYLIQCAVVALILITCIAFIVSTINNILITGIEGTIGFFLMIWPGAVLFGFIAILITLGPCMKLAAKIAHFDPTKLQHEGSGAAYAN